ncbi:ATPase [Bifidobacterium sp. ESL0798]|uniref:ATPase n=1 Tax=Bifidobacterium sp. ESL0798 TaxID=2983235 RepID=UPI0023F9F7CC|nr:ATPase [Bifidobacterium sp. ESL0798]WEV73732.1 ATPase [Bifidobacterium sp. ESL0798]
MPQTQRLGEVSRTEKKGRDENGCASPDDSPKNKSIVTHAFAKRTVVFLSASGGVGLSALCSLTALQFKDRGRSAALVDADFGAGGLDILLGLENDKGLRFGTLNAPLGKIDGDVLSRRLPHWEGIPVLAYDSWNSEIPEWWEVEAAMSALERSVDAVLIDGADGRVVDMVPELRLAPVVVVIELSVLGLARAKALLGKVVSGHFNSIGRRDDCSADDGMDSHEYSVQSCSQSCGDGLAADGEGEYFEDYGTTRLAAIVGIEPRGTSRRRGVVDINEASEYLGHQILGPICPGNARTSDALEGLGLKIAKADRTVMAELAHAVSDAVDGGERH